MSQVSCKFGEFELDSARYELRRNGQRLKVERIPMELLILLVEKDGNVVTRQEIVERLWGKNVFVDTEHGINTAIRKVRSALRDNPDHPRFIQTVSGKGYRFVAEKNGEVAAVTPADIGTSEESLFRTPLDAPIEGFEPIPTQPTTQTFGIDSQAALRHARWLVAAGTVVAILIGSGYLYIHRTPRLTEKDTIIIADFKNATGDPVFDDTLRQGLSVQLGQSPFFNVLSGDRIAEQIRLMAKPPETRLTPDIAREVCERLNARAKIDGSIVTLDNQYVIGLNAVNCHTGEILAQEQVTADGKAKVLAALGEAASMLRSKLGESRASLKAYDVPLVQATTSSLEALQAFNRCEQEFFKADYLDAVSSCKRATDIDSNFANAHGLLGILYTILRENDLAAEAVRKAYDLRDRASEREKLLILWEYYFFGTADLERTLQVSQQHVQAYPQDERAFIGLGTCYRMLGRYDEAIAAHRQVLQLDPAVTIAYAYLGLSYISQNRLDEARSIVESARARSLDSPDFPFILYEIDFLQKDLTGTALQASRLDPGTRLVLEANMAAYTGQLSHSRSVTRSAIAAATQTNARQTVAGLAANLALQEALYGNPAEARAIALEALKLKKEFTDWRTEGTAAFTLALAGDTGQTERLAIDLNRRIPEGTFIQFVYLPAIRAAVALNQGRPVEAINSLRVAAPYELTPGAIFSVYLRGNAYLAANRGVEAAAEFQKIIVHPGIVLTQPIGPLAHLGLGRAYLLQGNTAQARTSYEEFLTLWKDANSDIPILKEARAEYAKLQ
jgi:eukaryotic-like serine/threonine-protein kinase